MEMTDSKNIRVLHFSTCNSGGGGFEAAKRIHYAFLENNIHSKMVVRDEIDRTLETVVIGLPQPDFLTRLLRLQMRIRFRSYRLPKSDHVFNLNWPAAMDRKKLDTILEEGWDFILLHWVVGFLCTDDLLKIKAKSGARKIYQLAMDLEPIAGGCCYPLGCVKFITGCGKCPQLSSHKQIDWSRRVFELKKKTFKKCKITLISNNWVNTYSARSAIWKGLAVENIPLPIDSDEFHIGNKLEARKKLGLPLSGKLILAASYLDKEKRKGSGYLKEIYKQVLDDPRFNSVKPSFVFVGNKFEGTGASCINLGKISYDKLIIAYQAVDLFICPSVEDAGPMMVSEAALCGLPTIAFPVGIAVDLLINAHYGLLVDDFNEKKFVDAIYDLLGSLHCIDSSKIRENALRLHSSHKVVDKYMKIFNKEISTTKL